MTSPDRKYSIELKVGEMPSPRYLLRAGDTTGEGSIRWIGVEAYSIDREIKPFLWWRNFKIGDLNDPQARYDAAAFVARLKMEMGADSVIGPAIDLGTSNPRTGSVRTIEESGVFGVYIEAQKRGMFNFMAMMNGVKTEEELRQRNRLEFDEIFQKAKAVLPLPKSADEKQNKSESLNYGLVSVEFGVGDITKAGSDAIITLINSSGMWFGGVDTAIQNVTGKFHKSAESYLNKNPGGRDGATIFADGTSILGRREFRSVIFVIDDLKLPLGKLVEAGLVEAYRHNLQTVTIPLMRTGVMAGAKEKTLEEVASQMMIGVKKAADKNPTKPLTAKIIAYSDEDESKRNALRTQAKRLFQDA